MDDVVEKNEEWRCVGGLEGWRVGGGCKGILGGGRGWWMVDGGVWCVWAIGGNPRVEGVRGVWVCRGKVQRSLHLTQTKGSRRNGGTVFEGALQGTCHLTRAETGPARLPTFLQAGMAGRLTSYRPRGDVRRRTEHGRVALVVTAHRHQTFTLFAPSLSFLLLC